MLSPWRIARLATVLAFLSGPTYAFAQTDEIQVYDGSLAPRGTFTLTLHHNFTPSGGNVPPFPGAVVADKSFNGVPEFALGIADWFEAGLYLPLYTRDKNSGFGLDGFKLRTLLAVPHAADRVFVYGVNVEFSCNARRWDATRFTSEIRPIIGWHLKSVDIIMNPIVDTAYDGAGKAVFAPAARVAYNVSAVWAVALEEYADLGPFHHLRAGRDQAHQLYGVVDRSGKHWNIEAGAGVGLTKGSNGLTLKLIVARDLASFRRTP
jgi:hypothetical protein